MSENPYLSDNFAPVEEEVTAFDLDVTGEIPRELAGRLLRIGPNPIDPDPTPSVSIQQVALRYQDRPSPEEKMAPRLRHELNDSVTARKLRPTLLTYRHPPTSLHSQAITAAAWPNSVSAGAGSSRCSVAKAPVWTSAPSPRPPTAG